MASWRNFFAQLSCRSSMSSNLLVQRLNDFSPTDFFQHQISFFDFHVQSFLPKSPPSCQLLFPSLHFPLSLNLFSLSLNTNGKCHVIHPPELWVAYFITKMGYTHTHTHTHACIYTHTHRGVKSNNSPRSDVLSLSHAHTLTKMKFRYSFSLHPCIVLTALS